LATTMTMRVTMKLTMEVQEALKETEIAINPAFFEACERCGIDPFDLQSRSIKSFRRPTDGVLDEKVLTIRHQGFEKVRQAKLSRVLKEQESVGLMLSTHVNPRLIAVEEPWLVEGAPASGKGRNKEATQLSAQEMIDDMIAKQEARALDMKEKERCALVAAMTRQAREVQRMVAGEKATAEKSKQVAVEEAEKAAEQAEVAKKVAKKKKDDATKAVAALQAAKLEEEDAYKKLMEQLAKEKEEDHVAKEQLKKDDLERQRSRLEKAKAADEAVVARRLKTELVYKEIDKRADENQKKLEEKEKEVLLRAAQKKEQLAGANAAKQEESQKRIAAVLDSQTLKQKEKRRSYEERVKANEERRSEKAREEEEERGRTLKRLDDEDKKRAQAYEAAKFQHAKRIGDIVEHAETKGRVFGELYQARQEAHRQTVARNENNQTAIRENVDRYMKIHEQKRLQQEARIDEEDARVLQIKQSKKDLLFKRNLASHQAVIRKQLIRDKLGEMKSTQNFKGLSKLSKIAGLGDADVFSSTESPDHGATVMGSTGGAAAEPNSPGAS